MCLAMQGLINQEPLKVCQIVPKAVPSHITLALRLLLGSTALLLGPLAQRPASACSTVPPPPALVGFPTDGEVGVPTDVVPFYALYAVGIQDVGGSVDSPELAQARFDLRNSGGEMIGVRAATPHVGQFDLTPERQLQPNTTYTLSVTVKPVSAPSVIQTISFTTGDGPVSSVPAPPQALLQHYQFAQPLKSDCSPWAQGTCVAVAAGLPVEALEETNIEEFGPEHEGGYMYRGPWFTNLSGINQGTPSKCVRLRTRAANATYSAPLVLCGAGAPLLSISGSENIACTSQGITQDGVLIGASTATSDRPAQAAGAQDGTLSATSATSGGCSMATGSTKSANAGTPGLLALVLVLATSFGRYPRRLRGALR